MGPGTFIRTDHLTQQPSIGRRRSTGPFLDINIMFRCHDNARALSARYISAGPNHKFRVHQIGREEAAKYSWHSFRIGLACALRAAGCPPDVVQLICRWMCAESLRIYSLKGVSEHAHWISRAQDAPVDAVRGAVYPIISAGEGAHALDIECAAPFSDQTERDIADEAMPTAWARPATAQRPATRPPLPRRNPVLARLLDEHGVETPPRASVAERQRLLLVARPRLAHQYDVPDDACLAQRGWLSSTPRR